jgi:histidinol-phosphatase
MKFEQELSFARQVCAEAGLIQGTTGGRGLRPDIKSDHSPVTDIDRRCEELIVERIAKRFPSDGILGEEGVNAPGTSGRRWIVDPLDGTRPYVRGIPTYSVLVALEAEGAPVVGVMQLPAMGLTCWAAKGRGAFLNDEAIRVSSTARAAQAMGSGLGFVERAGEASGKALLAFMGQWDYGYGFMDAYTYVCVASGRLDLCVNLLDKPWDCAAAACIVAEAGGRWSDVNGAPSVHNGSIVLSNGVLHQEIIDFFRRPS